jgi:hypothetical protein
MVMPAMQRAVSKSSDVGDHTLHGAFLLLHAAIIAYVVGGWLISDTTALLVYAVVLPLLALQWLLNGGASVVSNLEILARTGHWSDPTLGLEATLFRRGFAAVAVRLGNGEVNVLVLTLMSVFWAAAIYRMILIAPALPPG